MTSQADSPTGMLARKPALALGLIAGTLSLLALAPMPGGYYSFLRFALCVCAVGLVVFELRAGKVWTLLFVIPVLVLWAPARFVTFERPTWAVLNVVFGLGFVAVAALVPAPIKSSDEEGRTQPWAWWKVTAVVLGVGLFIGLAMSGGSPGNPDCVYVADSRGGSCE